MEAMISERGNGFPQDGEVITEYIGGDLYAYRVLSSGPILTHNCPSYGNYIYAELEPIDPDEVDEDDLTFARPVDIEFMSSAAEDETDG